MRWCPPWDNVLHVLPWDNVLPQFGRGPGMVFASGQTKWLLRFPNQRTPLLLRLLRGNITQLPSCPPTIHCLDQEFGKTQNQKVVRYLWGLRWRFFYYKMHCRHNISMSISPNCLLARQPFIASDQKCTQNLNRKGVSYLWALGGQHTFMLFTTRFSAGITNQHHPTAFLPGNHSSS